MDIGSGVIRSSSASDKRRNLAGVQVHPSQAQDKAAKQIRKVAKPKRAPLPINDIQVLAFSPAIDISVLRQVVFIFIFNNK